MGTCGCRYCPVSAPGCAERSAFGDAFNLHKMVISHIATVKGVETPSDPIETHTRKCLVDSAKSKVLSAFLDFLKLESDPWKLIEELKEKIMSAS